MNVNYINLTMKKIVIILLIAVALAKGKQNEAFLGIDLGITNCYIAVYKDGNVEIIPNDLGENRTPSYVAFKNGDRLVGEAAKNEALFNPENTIFQFNRIIGKNWQDPQFQNDIYLFPYKIVEKNNKPHISVNTGDAEALFAPEEVSAILLKNMKDMAEKYLGTNVTAAVITVPAYFNDDQRKYTKEAGRIAGWNNLRITDEPVAAAVAYGFHKKGGDKNVLVIHLGGGTLEVSILNIHKGVIKIVASRKDVHFGGENFNEVVLHYYVKLCQEKGIELTYDKDADIYKLRREIEKAKHILSFEQEAKIEIKSFLQGQDLSETLTRAKFEELSSYLFVLTLEFVQTVLKEATIGTPDIDEIIFVGGSTQIPKLQQIVKMYFNKEPAEGVDPDKAVAYGAAIQGNIFYKKDNAHNIIMANPYTLGIEAVGGVMLKLTPRFTSMPSKNSTIISTNSDNQETVTIKIYEGERFMAKHNKLLDEIKLTGVEKAVKGVPQIEVEFELDVDGILHVSAKYKGTEVKKCILIESAQDGLNPNDVNRLHKEVEQFAEEDERIKAREDTRIQFESYLLSVQRQVQQLDKVQRAIDDGVTWLKDNQEEKIEEYKKQQEAMETVVQNIMNKYQTAHDKDEL